MFRIQNPNTGRLVQVRSMHVDPKDVLSRFKSGEFKTAKDLSWHLLEQKVQDMETTVSGESAESNLALAVFEQGLDWSIGLAALGYIKAVISKYGRRPKAFHVCVSRKGDVFIRTFKGHIVAW